MKKLFALIFALVISPASAQTGETTEGCLYSKDEIKAAFGGEVSKFYGTKMTHERWGGGKILFCHYVLRSSSISSLSLVLSTSGTNTDLPKKLPDPWMKGTEPIPDDPDGALWRIAGPSSLHLIYFRGNTQTKIDITHDPYKPLLDIQWRALKLRRIPQAGNVSEKQHLSISSNDVNKDLESLQGTWRLISAEKKGAERSKSELSVFRRVINGNEMIFYKGDKVINRASFKIDPLKTPKEIDVFFNGKPRFGIYMLKDNSLTLCFAPSGKDRPTAFKTSTDSSQKENSWSLGVLTRENHSNRR
jgi:uncharacterized protein (TIGR03067 family)